MVQVTQKFDATHVHVCHTHVHFQGMCAHVCSLTLFMFELYTPCPFTVIHTRMYCCKLVAYADRLAYAKSTIWAQKIVDFFILAPS